ncbi:MAG: STAS domain-containing protein [Eubacteriaceae bacterium]
MLSINKIEDETSWTIKLIGEVDIYTVDNLKKAMEEVMNKKTKDVILDFERLEYIDSTGLGALISMKGKYEDISLHLINLKSNVKKLFDMTGLTKIFLVK